MEWCLGRKGVSDLFGEMASQNSIAAWSQFCMKNSCVYVFKGWGSKKFKRAPSVCCLLISVVYRFLLQNRESQEKHLNKIRKDPLSLRPAEGSVTSNLTILIFYRVSLEPRESEEKEWVSSGSVYQAPPAAHLSLHKPVTGWLFTIMTYHRDCSSLWFRFLSPLSPQPTGLQAHCQVERHPMG